jgi:hypothetical protein
MSSECQLVSLKCKVAPGAFSGERIFTVALADGKIYRSLVPRQFCWNAEGRIVTENEPTSEVDGFIAARIIDADDADQPIVEVPNGEIIAVGREIVQKRPTSIKPSEQNHYVPV